jgi:putative NADH-flavin reductase
MSNVVVFGAGGTAGSRIVAEAARRGHHVTAAVRRPEALTNLPPGVEAVPGDPTSPRSVKELAPGADVLVVAIGGLGRTVWREAAETLVTCLRDLPGPTPRIIHMGGGATLTTPDGTRFVDTSDFPDQYRDPALGQGDALDYYRSSTGVPWTYISPPPLEFHPGERTGHYRTGSDQPVTDEQGRSVLSYEDLAVAVVDEIENPRFLNTRFTAAY